MSTSHFLYVGPYVEFVLSDSPKGFFDQFDQEDDLSSVFASNLGLEDGFSRLIAGEQRRCLCFMPKERRAGWPRRILYPVNSMLGSGALDLRKTNQDAEIEWFKRKYANELKKLVNVYNVPTTVKWGIVWWTS